MQIFLAILDFVKSLAWPLCVVGLAWFFQLEIRALFKRVQKIGLDGAQFEGNPQVPSTVKQTIDPENLQDVGLDRTDFMGEVERRILADVNLVNDEKRVPLLVRYLAQSRIETACERIYSIIFGSQIEGLRELQKAGGRVSVADGNRYFDRVKAQFPDFFEKIDFSQWLSYLVRSELISLSESTIQLTSFGHDFLLYLKARGLPNRHY